MKYLFTLIIGVTLYCSNAEAQEIIFHYNPYSGYNADQLNLAMEQSTRMKRNGIIATGVGTGMLVTGSYLLFDALYTSSDQAFKPGEFGVGIGLMCFSGFPLGYGMVAWITGSEQAKLIEIELLASENSNLKISPTPNGFGLLYSFGTGK